MAYFVMTHYVTNDMDDGLVHVQNAVNGMLGQHHVHTKQGYENWKAMAHISPDSIHVLNAEKCGCGLKAGDVKEFDGKVWHNDTWESQPAKAKVKPTSTKQTKLKVGKER